jgi:hypothetical protein
VIVKLGSLGSRWLRAGPDGDVVMPAPRVTPVDTTGAGDAFSAGFLAAWLRGAAPATCLATGNTVGASSTRAAGGLDALPHAKSLPAILRPHPSAPARRPGLPRALKTVSRRTSAKRRGAKTAAKKTPAKNRPALTKRPTKNLAKKSLAKKKPQPATRPRRQS